VEAVDDGIARMGEIVYSSTGTPVLRALGLGSCIGLCVFDPGTKMAAMAHIMLPESRNKDNPELGKYADTAVPKVIEEMVAKGASRSRLRVAIAGGAQLFAFAGATDRLDVGKRNIEAVKVALKGCQLKLVAEDVGGKTGRTVTMDSATGEITVRQVGGVERPLTRLS
jgi:chemotaxis protein CheD